MAIVSFSSLGAYKNDEVNYVNFCEQEIEVKQYLPITEKYDLIMISLQQAKEDNIHNKIKLTVFFHLNLVFSYTNLFFTPEEREDLFGLYDILQSSGFIQNIINAIPKEEYDFLIKMLDIMDIELIAADRSFAGALNNFINQLPGNAQAAAEIMEKFNPEQFSEVVNFAKSAGMQ